MWPILRFALWHVRFAGGSRLAPRGGPYAVRSVPHPGARSRLVGLLMRLPNLLEARVLVTIDQTDAASGGIAGQSRTRPLDSRRPQPCSTRRHLACSRNAVAAWADLERARSARTDDAITPGPVRPPRRAHGRILSHLGLPSIRPVRPPSLEGFLRHQRAQDVATEVCEVALVAGRHCDVGVQVEPSRWACRGPPEVTIGAAASPPRRVTDGRRAEALSMRSKTTGRWPPLVRRELRHPVDG